ncbi:MAG TPA: hypothetical protein VIA82_07775, partial [Candidatus Limnocylindria bacterium]
AVTVGVATSLKVVPAAYAVVWLARREWRHAIASILVAVVLLAPMLLFDLSAYVTTPGGGLESAYAASPVLWAVLAAVVAMVTLWLAIRRSPYVWVAASLLMFVGPPRVTTSYLAFLVVGYLLTVRELDASGSMAERDGDVRRDTSSPRS